MHRKKFIAILAIVFAIVGIILAYALHVPRISADARKAVEISKQYPVVQSFLSQRPSAVYEVGKVYVESDGSVYGVSDNWEVKEHQGSLVSPIDGENHYCWAITWKDPTSRIGYSIIVCVDKDSWEIVAVQETF
jgi:hypothetical protein